jgi:acyl carrier protein
MINNEAVKKIVSDVLGVPIDTITENSSPDNIEKWDSMSHINLVMAIEAKFNVSLTPEDTMDMLSLKLIVIILNEKLENK